MESTSVHAYDLVTGKHLTRLPYTKCSWNDRMNQAGGMTVDIDMSDTAKGMGLGDLLEPWKVILSHERGTDIIHAGPLTSLDWDADQRRLSMTCGGGLTLLTKRLVLNRRIRDTWRDGSVLVDEQHPAGDLALTVKGSPRDIIRALIDETIQWGKLPFTLPDVEGGDLSITYAAWDLATIAERIAELDCEYRFPSTHTADGGITFGVETGDSQTETARWNAIIPDSRIILDGLASDAGDLCTQVWATGGKENDRTYMCRRTSTRLTDEGWPLMQGRDTSHTTVSDLKTLQSNALAQLQETAWVDRTFSLKVGEEHEPHVGDLVDLTVDDDCLGRRTYSLKITDVSGDSSSDWLTVKAQEREDK